MKLAQNLLKAVAEAGEKHHKDYLNQVIEFTDQLEIDNRFFAESLWWGVKKDKVEDVIIYFEAKAKLAEGDTKLYRPCLNDFLYFKPPDCLFQEV
jgi:hypothetical protein